MSKRKIRNIHPERFDEKGRPHIWVLRALIDYDPGTGSMTWKERGPEWFDEFVMNNGSVVSPEAQARRWNNKYAGKSALSEVDRKGHPLFTIDVLKHNMSGLALAWAMSRGTWHNGRVTVRDENSLNLAADNLVKLSEVVAKRNREAWFFKPRPDATSQYIGVGKVGDRWRSYINVNEKRIYLGTYNTEHEAADAYDRAALKYFGPTAYLNAADHPEPEPEPVAPEPVIIDPTVTDEDDF